MEKRQGRGNSNTTCTRLSNEQAESHKAVKSVHNQSSILKKNQIQLPPVLTLCANCSQISTSPNTPVSLHSSREVGEEGETRGFGGSADTKPCKCTGLGATGAQHKETLRHAAISVDNMR